VAEMGALSDELRQFCARHGYVAAPPSMARGKASALARFYEELASAAKLSDGPKTAFADWIRLAAERLCEWDDLVDVHHVLPSMARSVLFDAGPDHEEALAHGLGMPRELLGSLVEGQGSEAQYQVFRARIGIAVQEYHQLRRRVRMASACEQGLVEAMAVDYLDFFLLQESALERVEECLRLESRLRDGDRMTEERLTEMTLRATQRFAFLSEVLFRAMVADGIGSPVTRAMDDFLSDYCQLCGVMDHLADVEEDAANGTYNLLLCRNLTITGATLGSPDSLWESLAQSGALREVLHAASYLYEHASWSLSCVTHPGLGALFTRLLDGAWTGLCALMKHNSLLDYPDPFRRRAKLLLMKPLPWAELSFEEAFGA